MNSSESLDSNALRQRIAALEEDLRNAQVVKEDAELHAHKMAQHAHHAAANLATFGHTDTVVFVEPEEREQGYLCLMSQRSGVFASMCRFLVRYNIDQFVQRPVLRQWLFRGKIYREASERQSSRFELFFDLLFVGLVHQIAEAAAEEPTGIGFAKYVLTFCPAYSIWADVRDISNQFGANYDVTQRAYILWIMILLVGYSNNASTIRWGQTIDGEITNPGSIDAESMSAAQWTLGFFVMAKLSKVILHLVYGFFLPLSRQPLLISSTNSAIATVLFFVAIFTPIRGMVTLITVGIVLDYVLRIMGLMIFKTLEVLGRKHHRLKKRITEHCTDMESPKGEKIEEVEENDGSSGRASREASRPTLYERMDSATTVNSEEAPLRGNRQCNMAVKKDYRIPAVNIEHHVDRLGAFVTIVLGEMVVNVFYRSASATGLNVESGRALLGIMVAFNLNWLYFDSERVSSRFVHALRRHWFTSFVFTMLHLPLCMSLLLASSAMNRLVISSISDSISGGGIKWFFGSGLGVSVCTMATIGVLHKNLDDEIPRGGTDSARASMLRVRRVFSRRVVIATRYAAGISMALVPLTKGLSSIGYLSIYVGITAFLIIGETVARIERREWGLELQQEKRGVA